ncbi:MAG: ABC transporter ATP-binding protein [Bacteroidales bacterium]|nr:ABC transporter ATP-binding protein [Clostridium sp.]MCM1204858.1 ABC transporter ATP-binding protein [Bacteroidales bacterium]
MDDKEKNILEVENLCKTFQKNEFSLNNISFTLPHGAIMGFVGGNGAGKTTTIGCILGALKKDSGSIRLFGREINGNDIDVDIKEQIGVAYDTSNFSGELTPQRLSRIMQGIYRQWDNDIYLQYLSKFHLPIQQRISTFSKGMTMKLALAVAISHSSKLLVFDEITSGLDPIARDEVLDIFLDFVQDESRSILISSHITSDLEKVADYITFIHDGELLLSASIDDLRYKYGIVRCRLEQFERIHEEDIVAYIKKDYQIDVLVSDRDYILGKYGDLVIDNALIDDILMLLVRGKKGERIIS